MKKILELILTLVCMLAACSALADAHIVKTHVLGQKAESMIEGGAVFNAYQLNLLDDSSYILTKTVCNYGYSMLLGTTTVTTCGTYAMGDTEDGITAVSLSEATRVILNAYSDMGGFDIYIDTDLTDFSGAVELPAETQGEKNMASSAADVIAKYGAATKVYVSADSNVSKFYLTNPNE